MKFNLFLVFISLSVVGTVLANEKLAPDITKKNLDLPEFHSIYVNSDYTVYLKQTNKQEVTVEALTELFEVSEFKVEDGVLHINIERKKQPENKSLWSKLDNIKIAPTLKVIISMRDIRKLHVNGSGKIISENSIASNSLDLAVRGSGSIDLDIKGQRVTTNLSGPGNIMLKGYATHNSINISGPGTIQSFSLELEKASVSISGSGNCNLRVRDELNAEVYGSGQIKHKGNTTTVVQKIYGSGEIARAY